MKRASFAVLVVFLGGCVNQLGSGEERLSHDRSEMRVSPAELQDWARDGSWIVSPRLEAPEGVSRVGALIVLDAAGPLPALEARSLDDGVPQGDWRPLAATWSEEDHHVAVVDLADVGDGAQIRMAAVAATAIAHFRWTATVPETTEDALDDRGVAREALRSELSDLGVVTRAEWGARATRCSSRDTSKTRMAIHHTVSGATDPERELRGIQRYHMDSRGWCDVGYHFLVGQDGRVYEGRPLELLGAHVGGANTGNVGIAFIGCFDESGCGSLSGSRTPNDASLDAAAALIGRLAEVYGIDIDASAIKGHGEHAGQSTSCPGAHLAAKLDSLRARAASAGSTPPPAPAPAPTPEPEPTPEPTPEPAPSPSPAPAPTGADCTHSFGGVYSDTACSTSWQCCDGTWRSRGACGECACVEASGSTGCRASGSPAPAPSGPSCTVGGVSGTCVSVSACAGTSTPGYCPGPADIQCCTVRAEGGGGACDPADHPTPNAGLTEEPGDPGCPAGMVNLGSFCIDRFEASLVLVDGAGRPIGSWSPFHDPGTNRVAAVSLRDAVPQGYINGIQAASACEAAGKRLCSNTEWLRACQGAAGRTYPYGNTRQPGVCNDARAEHPAVERFGTSASWIWSELDDACINQIPDSVALTGSHPGCTTPEGVLDMMGNLHEWTSDSAGTFRGGFYADTRINGEGCLYRTTAHSTSHHDYSTGFRCCAATE